jgi:hypothetical protein
MKESNYVFIGLYKIDRDMLLTLARYGKYQIIMIILQAHNWMYLWRWLKCIPVFFFFFPLVFSGFFTLLMIYVC